MNRTCKRKCLYFVVEALLTETFHSGSMLDCLQVYKLALYSGYYHILQEKVDLLSSILANRYNYTGPISSFKEVVLKHIDETSALRKLSIHNGYILTTKYQKIQFCPEEFFLLLKQTSLKGVRTIAILSDDSKFQLDREEETLTLSFGSTTSFQVKTTFSKVGSIGIFEKFSGSHYVTNKLSWQSGSVLIVYEGMTDHSNIKTMLKRRDRILTVVEGVDAIGNPILRNGIEYRKDYREERGQITTNTRTVSFYGDIFYHDRLDSASFNISSSKVRSYPEWMLDGIILYELTHSDSMNRSLEELCKPHDDDVEYDEVMCSYSRKESQVFCGRIGSISPSSKFVIFKSLEYRIVEYLEKGDYFFTIIDMH